MGEFCWVSSCFQRQRLWHGRRERRISRASGSRTTIAVSRSAMARSRLESSIANRSSRWKHRSRAIPQARGTRSEVHNRWKFSVSTGADGDEFKTSVVWKDSRLVFSIEEHEDGRILQSKETWSVIEDGATLERIREHPNGEKQTLFFRRIRVSQSDSKSVFVKAGDK